MSNKKGKFPVWAIVVIATIVLAGMVWGAFSVGKLSTLSTQQQQDAPTEYEGEFDDAYLATDGNFYSDFSEQVDCNITDEVLGGSDYNSCIYRTHSNVSSSTKYRFDLVLNIDDAVENMEIEAELQNSGTGQAADDFVIKEASLWTYDEEDSEELRSFAIDNEDAVIEDETGMLQDGEYVFHTVLKSLDVSPSFAEGDNIMLADFDLDTDAEVDAGRITLEAN